MKRKGSKKVQKTEDDSNGVEDQFEENGGASDIEEDSVEEEPKDKKRKSSKSNRKNVSFSKKGENATESDPFEDVEDLKKSKDKKKKGKDSKAESSEEDAEDEDDESQYEVQKVLDEKMIKGVRHFLIRWKGYEEESDTWEPEDTLNCPDIINEFKESKKKPKGKKEKAKKEKKESESAEWDENEDFEVDKILEVHHKKNGKREFLVSWKGFASKDNTWEPEDNMNCKDLIAKFMAKVEKARGFEDRDLRVDRKRVQRLTYNTPDSNRRLSKRMSGKERVQYHDTE